MQEKHNSHVTIVVNSLGKKSTTQKPSNQPKPKTHRALKVILVILLVLLGILSYIFFKAFAISDKIFVGQKMTFSQKISGLFRGSTGSVKLVGEDLGQVNVLLLGIGGQGHNGPYLSDTIILAQIRPDIKTVVMTAIPRDYLVDIPGYGKRKINSAFAEGYYKYKNFNDAGKMAREAVEKVTGINIPYFVVIDFSGFEKAIDKVGGLEVQIDRTFTDYTYPDENYGYLPPQTFKEGIEKMNGKRALIFARSRHAGGQEGSDFARSQRQQKIIKAFKAKVISLNLVTDISTLNNLINTLADHLHTNISLTEIFRIFTLGKDIDSNKIITTSLDPSSKLICSDILPENGAYVLVPCSGKTPEDIKFFFKNAFVMGGLNSEQAKIWLSADSEDNLAYEEIFKELDTAGLTVNYVKNTLPVPRHSVFQVNPKPQTVDYLRKTFGIQEITTLPEGFKINKEKVDLIILIEQAGNLKTSAPKAQ